MKISELLADIEYELLQAGPDAEVTGICHDNRKLKAGDAFVCIQGVHFDTHNVTEQIAAGGAVLIVCEREVKVPAGVTVIQVASTRSATAYLAAAFYGHPEKQMTLIAITGSKGKTTATHIMAAILREAGLNTGTIGTNGAIFPLCPEALTVSGAERFHYTEAPELPGYFYYETHNTTPEPMELYMYMAMMVKAGCTHLVMEVSSQAAKQNRTDGLHYEYGIWTNLATGDHIGPTEHPTFEDYMACKAVVLNASRVCFLNADDPYYQDFLPYIEPADPAKGRFLYTYGEGRGDLHAYDAMTGDGMTAGGERFDEKAKAASAPDYIGTGLRKRYDETRREPFLDFSVRGKCAIDVSMNMPGEFNMYNALPCIALADQLGVPHAAIQSALSHLRIRARYEMVFDNGHIRVCVDYAHNGYSMLHHLEGLREYQPKRLICVYSADGARDIARRPEQGAISARLADVSVVTEGHSRFEPFENIARGILEGIEQAQAELGHRTDYVVIPDRAKAIRYAMSIAEDGDIVTIIGVGLHKSYLDIMGVEVPHSDAECVHRFAAELGL
ncbi:MAG: UDP-N-acetylmuramoyl-L-alanyl-D-glutamate--2,6-diaminopimelate ligase [Clostridia bacterium]|nr:UDP-N-acetylmuramoyl-L-alanyl-D-glutamate--2,6-diaminopimelate ligase [Clostridia bacterium]